MMNVLVIGGTRFIGRHLVEELLRKGHHVTLFHLGRQNPFGHQVEEIHADRLNHRAVRKALAGKSFDAVIDNAYVRERGTSAQDVAAMVEATREGLHHYVFTSSVAVYPFEFDMTEDWPLADRADPYTRDKAESERYLFDQHHKTGLPISMIRPPFVYGPYNDIYREAFFWDRMLLGRPIILPDQGQNLMQFAYVKDVAWALVRVLEVDAAVGQAYNIAHESPITQREFVESLARAAGTSVPLASVSRKRIRELGGNMFDEPLYFGVLFDIPSFSVRVDKARQQLGFRPTAWEDGLRETYEWYRREGRHARPLDFSFEDRVLQEAGYSR
ncbi:MAG: NAD-dependent epimerase/dehydratase family protein [Acidobacteria bacterium]|nr:NAD-dependent epimerase/dehydratase family protein [Acidobacteriota bacterium]